jgi:hypothetical protein
LWYRAQHCNGNGNGNGSNVGRGSIAWVISRCSGNGNGNGNASNVGRGSIAWVISWIDCDTGVTCA